MARSVRERHRWFDPCAVAASCVRSGAGVEMFGPTDMSTPVTRGELREELEHIHRKFQDFQQELRIELKAELAPLATKAELAPLATKAELKAELAPLATKAELAILATKAELVPLATKVELELWGGALLARIDRTEQRMSAELARHAGAIHEAMTALFAASDEKYADLPGRVNRLEYAVFAPK
jgi:hypothetical protein